MFHPRTRDGFAKLGWRVETVTADVFEWMQSAGEQRFDAVIANLFLHHFDNADLARLFSGLQRLAPVLVATEPRRGSFPLAAARLLWAIGANDVTLHDAAASVRAGFAGNGTVRPLAGRAGKAASRSGAAGCSAMSLPPPAN